MDWTRLALTVLIAGFAIAFADWLFMGVLFHDKYNAYPEVWRKPAGSSQTGLIIYSTLLGFVTAAVFVALCYRLDLHTYRATLKLALATWLIAPLPLLITNGLWMKLHPAITTSHSLGWLARLSLAAIAVSLIWR